MSWEDETYLDYKVTQEDSNDIITFTMTSLFCWRQQFHAVTSAFFSWNQVSYLWNHNFLTAYRIKVVDPSFYCSSIGLFKKWCLVDPSSHIFADVSIVSALFDKNMRKWRHVTSRDVTWSDFHQTFRKCFFPWYLGCVQIWSHLHYLNESWAYFKSRWHCKCMGFF